MRPPQLAHTPSRRTQRLLNVTTAMTQRAPAQRATISEGVAIVVSPENAPCALTSERATTHPLERSPLWPVLSCRRLAGFEVSTEGRKSSERSTNLGKLFAPSGKLQIDMAVGKLVPQ